MRATRETRAVRKDAARVVMVAGSYVDDPC